MVSGAVPQAAPVSAAPAAAGIARPAVQPALAVPGVAPAVGGSANLGAAVRDIQARQADEAKGMGEASVRGTLDRIFDAAKYSGRAATAVPGSVLHVREKIKQTVTIANKSSPRDAPDLYASAIKTAEDSFPAQIAGLLRQTVLGYAARKAVSALPDLANDAYRSAASGAKSEVQKAFKAFSKWQNLLGTPRQPLISNLERLTNDIERVLKESAAGRPIVAPRIWFQRIGAGFSAVLPAASVESVSAGLASDFALREKSAVSSSGDSAILRRFEERPTLSNGVKLVYQARRESRSSIVVSAWAAGSYGTRYGLSALWRVLKSFWLRLLGRAPQFGAGQGFTIEAPRDLEARLRSADARAQDFKVNGTQLRALKGSTRNSFWRQRISALAGMQAGYALVLGVLSRQAPIDLQSARTALGLAAAMAASHGLLSGDNSASVVVARMSRIVEESAVAQGWAPESTLGPGLARLIREPGAGSLRDWIARMHRSGEEDRKSTRLNSSHNPASRMPSSA
jgi:hypothetical protein